MTMCGFRILLLAIPILLLGPTVGGDPKDTLDHEFTDADDDGQAVRTFEFRCHRASILSVDDDSILLEWSPEQYFETARTEALTNEAGAPKTIDWVAAYDGLVWGRTDSDLAAQWNSERRPDEEEYWRFFNNPKRHDVGFKFPDDSRLMGMGNKFVWHGWCTNTIEFYSHEHRAEFEHIWVGLALARQIFLACVSPEEAFKKYACQGVEGEIREQVEDLGNGRVRREYEFVKDGLPIRISLRVDSAGRDPAKEPAEWRFVQRNLSTKKSRVFMGEWRETTPQSVRRLPELPRDVPGIHPDIESIESVGIRDRTGLGLWEGRPVEYLKVTPSVVALNWFSSLSGRLLTNLFVFSVLIAMLWRERISARS